MEVCFFLFGHHDDHDDVDGARPLIDVSLLDAASRDLPGLTRFVTHLPVKSASGDPLLKTDALSPCCVLQWYFDDLGLLETALQHDGAIHGIVDRATRETHGALTFVQQAMAVRRFATSDPDAPGDTGDTGAAGDPQHHAERCTYLVGYEGEAEDFNAWLTHYLTHHPPLMMQLPGIRELEIYTRVDYRSGLAIQRTTAMQRNKVVFDDPSALAAALASPIRAHMKQDFNTFPPYSGSTPHFPMRSIYGNLKPT